MDLEVVDTQKLLYHDQWVLVGSMAHLELRVASGVVCEVVSMVEEAVGASEVVLTEAEVDLVVVDEEELVTKAAEVSVTEVIVAGMEVLMVMLLPMHQLAQEVVVVVDSAEEEVEDLEQDRQIEMDLEDKVVGMNLVEAAHMMTDPADTVAAAIVAMVIAMEVLLVEVVAAIWSR